MSDFLKRLQEKLEKGEEISEYKERMGKILDKADNVENPDSKFRDRIKKAGEKEKLTEEEAIKSRREMKKFNKELEEKNEKLKLASMIEQRKNNIQKLKEEYEAEITAQKEKLIEIIVDFEEKYDVEYEDYIKNG